ncbi:DUF6477 family protein [Yoonia sediminilitoris]|uniref:Uncharacterized protein n=1 Tax=Yoonia sediminilitoris TaxID=1286148 RepID=A0A2T6KS76_9RHOB|nr:DUF6477 family protein [Yoonia sediminilitoris]PUB19375.1 hypothetical protein C8N45_101973 [Yoonia sediminilitoris]RCW99543.1 hypothetical protein DFP92_101973 [Yoonia sediminilitoris]
MLDIHTRIAQLRRPTLLARAARFGVDDYRRQTHLRRILNLENLPKHPQALILLLEIESELNKVRREKSGSYSPARHVAVLIAISGEARLMKAVGLHAI